MLPESQLDRFLMRLALGVPDREAERAILQGQDRREMLRAQPEILPWAALREMQERARRVYTAPALLDYVQDVLAATRAQGHGLSPRGGLALLAAARAWALGQGRPMVLPEDVQAVAPAVMGHRLAGGAAEAARLLEETPVP
jgi:MoxR-like ATPase